MIVATAGHIDHGKTSLVKAITGVDTDRLPEEKARGMTIDLGFAYLALPGGATLGFVDVPGHERFVRNMLAGVCNVDHALLVVAADDGPMPQTREHLGILDLLGVPSATVAITKADRVTPERLREVEAQVHAMLAGTALADAPLFVTSVASGEGVDALRDHLADAAARHRGRAASGRFRMAVDRCFILQGVGVVATGTVFAGSLKAGEALTIAPSGTATRARRLRFHDRDVGETRAGERCAVNLAGIEKADLERGDWLVAPEAVNGTQRIEVRLDVLGGEAQPLRHRLPGHLHIGAADVPCRVSLLEDKAIAPGGHGYASLALDRPIAAWTGDRFILRDQSATRTIGGGRVIDPAPPQRAPKVLRLARLAALDAPDAATAAARLLDAFERGVDLAAFAKAWNMSDAEEKELLAGLPAEIIDAGGARIGVAARHWQALLDGTVAALARHHREHPNLLGLNDDQVNALLPRRPLPPVLREAIARLRAQGKLRRTGTINYLASHRVVATREEFALWARVEPLLAGGGIRPPRVIELAEALKLDATVLESFLNRAEKLGWVRRVAKNRFYLPAPLTELKALAAKLAQNAPEGFGAAAFNQASGIGRNLTIQVLEYFDRTGVTQRRGDLRKIVG